MKRKITVGVLLATMLSCAAIGGSMLCKSTINASAADYLTTLDFNGAEVTIVGFEDKVRDSGAAGVFTADGVSKEMLTSNIADGGTITLKLGQAIKASDYKEIKISMCVGAWGTATNVLAYSVTDTAFTNPAGETGSCYGNILKTLTLDPSKLADANGNIEKIVLRRSGGAGQLFFDYMTLNARAGEKPTEDATLDFNGTEATIIGFEDKVRDSGAIGVFPADGVSKEMLTTSIADGGTVTVQLGETYKAEWLSEIQISMCVGAWGTSTNVIAYSVSDTGFTTAAGETGGCYGNVLKTLTIDPEKVADKNGYINQIVLKRSGGAGQLFFDYVKVVMKEDAPVTDGSPTETTMLDFNGTEITLVGFETIIKDSGTTTLFEADGWSKEMNTSNIADGGTVTIKFGQAYKAEWFDEINIRMGVGSWTSSTTVTGYSVTDTEFANPAGSQYYGYGNKVAILSLNPQMLADENGEIQQIVLKRVGDKGQMFFDWAEMVVADMVETTANASKSIDFDGTNAVILGREHIVYADNSPIAFGDGSTKATFTSSIESGGTATIKLAKSIPAASISSISVRMAVGSWGSGTDITAYSIADTNFENPAASLRFGYGNIIKTLTLDPAKLADENGNIQEIVIMRVGDSGQMFFDYVEVEYSNVYMLDGASVRMGTPTGLGFTTRIDYNYYNDLVAQYGEGYVRTGTLILPTDYLKSGVNFTISSLEENNTLFLNVVNDGWKNKDSAAQDGYYEYRGSISNIKEYNYERNFSSVGYVAYYANRMWTYVYTQYSEENNSRSIAYVSAMALNDVKAEKTGEYIYQIGEGEVNATKYSRYSKDQRDILQGYVPVPENYTIVVSSTASASEITAANILSENLNLATGETFAVVSDATVYSFNQNSKYISVGETKLLKNSYFFEVAGNDGYILKNLGTNLFIDGANDRGTVYGVMDYLETLGFEFIDSDCTAVPTLTSFAVEDIDVCFTPYVEIRSYLEYDVMTVYTDEQTAIARKTNNPYVEGDIANYGGTNVFGFYGNQSHNMLATLQKGIELSGDSVDYKAYCASYSGKYQPCLTNAKAIEYMAIAMKALIENSYANGVRYYMLTQEDSTEETGYCTCSTCNAAATTYGGRSGLLVNFINTIVNALDSDTGFVSKYPDYKIVTFAYAYTFNAPTVAMDTSDRMAIMICPINANYAYGILATKNNAESANAINGWANYTSNFMFWLYDANFSNYLEYHPTLTGVMADNVYNLKKLGAISIMVQGAYNADNMWDDKLRAYVYSELLYNFDEMAYKAGADAYVNSIVAKYLAAYYGEYADEVQSIITALQNACKGANAGAYTSAVKASMKSSQITELLTIINNAINASSGVIQTRLYAVKASLLACHYEVTTLASVYWSYKSEFKTACEYAGITQWAEGTTIADKFN